MVVVAGWSFIGLYPLYQSGPVGGGVCVRENERL